MEAWLSSRKQAWTASTFGGSFVQIQVTARHVEVSDDVHEYIHEKANKLPRYHDRIHEIEVILDHE